MGRSEKWKCQTKLFCPGPECTHYQKTDNKVTKDGFYTTKHDKPPRQRFDCHGGKPRVSETRASDLFNLGGSFKESEPVAKLSSHGLGGEAIAEVLDHDPRTIDKWLSAIGKNREPFHLFICLTMKLKLVFLPLDELGSDCLANYRKLGGVIGFEASAKLGINLEWGSRTQRTAYRLIKQIRGVGDCSQQRV